MKNMPCQEASRSGWHATVYLAVLLSVLCLLAFWPEISGALDLTWFLSIDNTRDIALYSAIVSVAILGGTSLVLLSRLQKLETQRGRDNHAALHDALTGAANRRQFEIRLDQLLDDDQASHTLLMIDLDRFKPINDLYGHAAGDALLREITLGIKRLVRHDDLVARLGGDEFALLLTNKVSVEAEQTALSVLRFVTGYRLTWDGQRLSVGASIGLVSINQRGQTATKVLAASDEALYAAKEAGRGAVFAAEFGDTPDEPIRFRRIHAEVQTPRPSANSHLPEDGRAQELRARIMTSIDSAFEGDRRRPHGSRRRYDTRHWLCLEPMTIGDDFTPGMSTRELVDDAAARDDGGADFARWVVAMAIDAASRMNPVTLGHIDFVMPVPARAFVVVPELAEELMRCNALSHFPIRHITFILHGIDSVYRSDALQRIADRFKASDIRLGFEIRSESLDVLAPLRHIQFDELHLGRELMKKLRPGSESTPIIEALFAVVDKTDTSLVAPCADTEDEVELLISNGIKRYAGPASGDSMPIHSLLSTLNQPGTSCTAR